MRIYLSAPLFTQVQRRWNRTLAAALKERIAGAEVTLPQDIAFRNAYNRPADFPKIFEQCLAAIRAADLVLAVLDGADADSGTAFEMGYAHALGIPVIGIRTDYRDNQDRGLNLVLAQACTELLRAMSFNEDIEQLLKDLIGKVAVAARRLGQRSRKGGAG